MSLNFFASFLLFQAVLDWDLKAERAYADGPTAGNADVGVGRLGY